MTSPIFDFSHLTPEERIQLAEELWDSLDPTAAPRIQCAPESGLSCLQ
jgi:putative addiction module component (TIGR02574 family)